MANKKKLLTSGVAVVAAVGVLFGGTFAWQSISQTALNEVSASVNPGGRLHDDFNDITGKALAAAAEGETTGPVTMTYDKNVYVENFTEYATNGAQVFARVRLDEYMELGQNAGKMNGEKKAADNRAKSVVAGAELDNKASWTTHKLNDENDPFHVYWNWDMEGDAVTYMPTFNRNKDSLEADINGSFAQNFTDYVDYTAEENATKTGIAIYDADAAAEGEKESDELAKALTDSFRTLDDVINADTLEDAENLLNGIDSSLLAENAPHVDLVEETHTAKQTLEGDVISMAAWKELAEEAQVGNYWVYDTDGWAYWAAPIKPESATAPLLGGIQRTEQIIDQDWYYAINVVAQFVTYDDLGQEDGTGFYDITEGTEPTADALALLSAIGVDVPTSDVASEEELTEALKLGGIVNVTEDIELTDNLTVSTGTVLNLGENILTTEGDVWADSKDECAMLYVDGTTLTIEGGNFEARENDALAVSVGNGGKVVINDGTFKGNYTAVYVHEGEAVINGGNFSIQQPYTEAGKEYNYVLNCYNENYQNGTAKITVCGGSFENFDPASSTAGDDGSFVPNGYQSKADGNVWTVTKTTSANSGEGETA